MWDIRYNEWYLQGRPDTSTHTCSSPLATPLRGVFALGATHGVLHHAAHARGIDGDERVATQQALLQVVWL